MRTFYSVFCLIFAASLTACTKTEAPSLGPPVPIETPAAASVSGPRFSEGHDDRLLLSWMEPTESGTRLRYSALVEGQFQDPVDVVTDPQMFVNWADLPSVTPLDDDHWIAHWLRYSAPQTYSYDVVVSQSHDGGTTWNEPLTAHTDGTPTEHGFVSIAPDVDGASLLWLDGRNTPDGSMTLRSAVITRDGRRMHEQEVDSSVCDCCQTDIAITADGPVAVYRDRTEDEVRDIYVSRQLDGQWAPGKRLYADNWVISGCPVNGPSIVARGNRVAVAWFSAAGDNPVVRLVDSSDSGASFADPVEIAAGQIAGYVGLTAMDHDGYAVSWVGRADDGQNLLRVRTVSLDGTLGAAQTISPIQQLRVFPQLAYRDGHLFFAWTDENNEQRRLFAARVAVTAP